jgi:hypothetical protein
MKVSFAERVTPSNDTFPAIEIWEAKRCQRKVSHGVLLRTRDTLTPSLPLMVTDDTLKNEGVICREGDTFLMTPSFAHQKGAV